MLELVLELLRIDRVGGAGLRDCAPERKKSEKLAELSCDALSCAAPVRHCCCADFNR